MSRAALFAAAALLCACAGQVRSLEERVAEALVSPNPGARAAAQAQLEGADTEARRLVAVALSRRLVEAAAAADEGAVAPAALALASLGPQAVVGAADALDERDLAFEVQLADGRPARDTGQENPPSIPFSPEESAARVAAFKARDEAVTLELSAALAQVGAPAVRPLLELASQKARPGRPPLSRPAPLMRAAASQALASMGEPAVPELARALKTPALRGAALRALGSAGSEGLKLLVTALAVDDPAIRKEAAAALREAVSRAEGAGWPERELLLARARQALRRYANSRP